jgi:hypothetical protein
MLAFEDEGEKQLEEFKAKFSEQHHRGNWYFCVPTIIQYIVALPSGAAFMEHLEKFIKHLAAVKVA